MILRPQTTITEKQLQRGLRLILGDGLAAEAMSTLSGVAFLTAMAVLLGASNLQIGILAGMPTFTNIFQLISISLVRRFNNRKAVAVITSWLARLPLVVLGTIIWFQRADIPIVFIFLFFYYFFGSIAGPAWNAWMKDLVPETMLGTYFSKRTSYSQTLNVALSLLLAFGLDYIRNHFPEFELRVYGIMLSVAGIVGIAGAWILSKAPEPKSELEKKNLFILFRRPLMDVNFRNLLIFNAVWAFALNISTPFFVVFMLKNMHLPLSYIIGLGILSQIFSIITIRFWGRYADRYSNKTIIAITAPLYIVCIIAWCYVGIYHALVINIVLLVGIHIFSGISLSGINLAVTNIGLKLAPPGDAIVYLSVRNIIMAVFTSVAPLLGGWLADYFFKRSLNVDLSWTGPKGEKLVHFLSLNQWGFLFLISALIAILSIEILSKIKEKGEAEKDMVVRILRSNLRSNFKDYFIIGNLINLHGHIKSMFRKGRSVPNLREDPAPDGT